MIESANMLSDVQFLEIKYCLDCIYKLRMNSEEVFYSKNNRIVRNHRPFPKKLEQQQEKANAKESNQMKTWNPAYNKSQEKRIIQLLQKIDYKEPNKTILNMKFDQVVRGHIRFICGQPQGQSLIGANLISNGMFHYLWEKVLSRQSSVNFNNLSPEYYENYRHSIMDNAQYFQKAFNPEKNPPNDQNPQKSDSNSKNSDSLMEEKTIWQSPLSEKEHTIVQIDSDQSGSGSSKGFLPLPDDQIDKNQQGFVQEENSSQIENQVTAFSYVPEQELNQRRIGAQIVCMFFQIPDRMIISIKKIKILQALEKYEVNKFQILVAKGVIKDQNPYQMQRVCISCYKFHNLEQLVRIQKAYGKVQVFMTHEEDFKLSEYLQKGQQPQKMAKNVDLDQKWEKKQQQQE